ncbi:MAG: hypothetical protein WCT14_09065 [Treponemataceae bacterium]
MNKKGVHTIKKTIFFCLLCGFIFYSFADEPKRPEQVLKINLGEAVLTGTNNFTFMSTWFIFYLPITYQWSFCPWMTLDASVDIAFLFPIPAGAMLSGGVSLYPLGKAPFGPYLNAMGGTAVSVNGFYPYWRASAGVQWSTNTGAVFDCGAGIKYIGYLSGSYNPYLSASFGWVY